MGAAINIAGRKVGRLTIVGRVGAYPNGDAKWLARCACGGECTVRTRSITRHMVTSCGCRARDTQFRPTHRGTGTPTYITWAAMRQRCHDPNASNFADYGGRGIQVCARWRDDFAAFLEDMGERPAGTTLDRVDPNGDYTKRNCRWVTAKEQARNKRSHRLVSYGGETLPLCVWAERTGLSWQALAARIRNGWSLERALQAPKRSYPKPRRTQ